MDALTRAGYLAHAMSAEHGRRIAEAQRVIDAHPGYAVSVSWGKDSVAMLSVVAESRPDAHVVFARYEHPAEVLGDLNAVRDAVLSRSGMRRIRYGEVTVPGEWQVFERVGRAFLSIDTREQGAAVAWWKSSFERTMRDALNGLGCSGWLIGMRGQESRARAINIAARGTSYVTAAGRATALPMARWSGADVWARLVAQDLPWLRIYDGAPDRERERSDLTWAVGGGGEHIRRGAVAAWRRAYPEQIAAWFARWPELRALTHQQ